jgi:hypothetical protein
MLTVSEEEDDDEEGINQSIRTSRGTETLTRPRALFK